MQFDFSNPVLITVLVVAALLIIVAVIAFESKRMRAVRLRKKFGSEYDRAVYEQGSERKAQAVLADREARVQKLQLRELAVAQRERFAADWNLVQSRFIDHPRGALTEADELVTALLQARGYPVSGFEQRAESISVDFPGMIESYRSAHKVAVLSVKGEASTEELRSAMIQYRTLFDELMKAETAAPAHKLQTGLTPVQSTVQGGRQS